LLAAVSQSAVSRGLDVGVIRIKPWLLLASLGQYGYTVIPEFYEIKFNVSLVKMNFLAFARCMNLFYQKNASIFLYK